MSSHEQVTQEMRDAFDAVCKGRVEAAVKAEREACAKVVLQREQEAHGSDFPDAYDFAKAIRARGNT